MHVIGLVSGTSCDAIEGLLCELTLDGPQLTARLLAHLSRPYPADLAGALAGMLPPAPTTLEAVCRLDAAVGHCFASLAVELARCAPSGRVELVASHGQTVFHGVDDGGRAFGTLQLGQAAVIAEATGATVVSDLRNRDVAAGGQGAPLTSMVDWLLVGAGCREPTALVNIGGIANVTLLAPGRAPMAYDIGPGNALLDAVARWASAGRASCDHDGALAGAGRFDPGALAALGEDPYFSLPAPKSTGRERFHLGYVLDRLAHRPLSVPDLLRTCTVFTAELVATELRAHAVSRVLVSGGGTRNPVLMAELRARCAPAVIESIDVLGVPEGAKEALVFAVLGFLSAHGLAGNLPSCTGAHHAVVLGTLTPGRHWPVPLAASAAPERLVVRREELVTATSVPV